MDQAQFASAERVEELRRAAAHHMDIQSVELGGVRQAFVVKFTGRLTGDPQVVYERLADPFRERGLTLWLREEPQGAVILATEGLIRPEPSNPFINLGLFLLTVLSVILAGALFANVRTFDTNFSEPLEFSVRTVLELLPGGIPFALSLMAILLAHEFGHYIAGRIHKTPVTLPYFLPFPGSILGTLGAFIRLKAPPLNRRILLDIGIAGPLAGLVVAIPILLVGLELSPIRHLPSGAPGEIGFTLEGNSLLYLAAKYVTKGELLPTPLSYGGVPPFLYWLRYFFTGQPVPFGGADVIVHPLAWAGWAGLLVTSLNLIPVGQLDGGHLIYGLFGKRAAGLWPVVVVILGAMGFIWTGWWIWAGLVFLLGRTHAPTLDQITELDGRRKVLAVFGLVVFVLTFSPVPLLPVGM